MKHETADHKFELDSSSVKWHGCYSLRRFHATQVRQESHSSETVASALGNSKEVANAFYIKREAVLPDVRKSVEKAMRGLVLAQ